jgi:ArsR family transcriptional regulator
MDKQQAISTLSALAQDTRLDIFRYLIEAGPQGVPAGQIGEHLNVPWATLSFHLKTLQQAGLVEGKRESRSIIYSANFTTMEALMGYLMENCCQGEPEACGLSAHKPTDGTNAREGITTGRERASSQ